MPCNSDYMEQNTKERQLQETAKILVYVIEAKGGVPSKEIQNASTEYYCNFNKGVSLLCKEIGEMTEEEMNTIVYDGRNPMARQTANWWELHVEADRLRDENKSAKEQQEEIAKIAIAKLTIEEREALGIKSV